MEAAQRRLLVRSSSHYVQLEKPVFFQVVIFTFLFVALVFVDTVLHSVVFLSHSLVVILSSVKITLE